MKKVHKENPHMAKLSSERMKQKEFMVSSDCLPIREQGVRRQRRAPPDRHD